MVTDNSSDMPLWLLWTASEYVLASRDMAFLDEQFPPGRLTDAPREARRVRNLLARCYRTRWKTSAWASMA